MRKWLPASTPRAARAMVAAGQLAAPEPLGAGHLAAALLSDPEGLAAKAIAAAGLTPEQVCAALGTGPAPRVETPDSAGLLELSFDQSAKEALKGALKSALRLSHNYIGTEHLLTGVLATDGPVTDAFAALGLPRQRAEELITAEIAAFQARKAG